MLKGVVLCGCQVLEKAEHFFVLWWNTRITDDILPLNQFMHFCIPWQYSAHCYHRLDLRELLAVRWLHNHAAQSAGYPVINRDGSQHYWALWYNQDMWKPDETEPFKFYFPEGMSFFMTASADRCLEIVFCTCNPLFAINTRVASERASSLKVCQLKHGAPSAEVIPYEKEASSTLYGNHLVREANH